MQNGNQHHIVLAYTTLVSVTSSSQYYVSVLHISVYAQIIGRPHGLVVNREHYLALMSRVRLSVRMALFVS